MALTSVAQLQALAHPVRQRVLRALAAGPKTNKQLAEVLGLAPGRVHFHVQELRRAGLIEVAATSPRGGVLEKYYRPTASRYRLDFALAEDQADQLAVLDAALTVVRDDYLQAAAHHAVQTPALTIVQEEAALTEAQRDRLLAQLAAFSEALRSSPTDSSVDQRARYLFTGIFQERDA